MERGGGGLCYWASSADDWDLQAVVRGCTSERVPRHPWFDGGAISIESSSTSTTTTAALLVDQAVNGDCDGDFLSAFPDLVSSLPAMELEESYKPFYSNNSSCEAPLLQKQKQKQARGLSVSGASHTHLRRSKRSKSQLRRVVCQVPAEGLPSDMWAWRKYGQKPIKGSPYPRGYYRCSSSKGCSARKQVERSRSDPGVFVITYTSEHNHPLPTHRNSLAGSTRNKPEASPTPADTTTSSQPPPTHNHPKPASSPPHLSPTTPLNMAANSNDLQKHQDEEEDEEGEVEEDDLFLELEELGQSGGGGATASAFAETFVGDFPWLS
ncbi:hypothetical protein AMTRI_Chr01g109490 [Amborella trichopoda]|uniref:WRKY domain-containing protein n=1 Tax=Amborella trichopoda TaxID=13333 RepID=W1P532_AMBTC|nr:WRKY transcription factor 22 [Amborella trichopoda]ERN05012.1 hypothetical protein AMTR_s00053p00025460 [Amborella trichopoda]|eukprot:XP_006843337.1 WRKY transcription factor 22 [Amborella trichopoda]